MAQLAKRTLTELSGHDVDQTVECYDRDGIYTSPISTVLDDVAFNSVDPDDSTVEFKVFLIEDDEMTLRVTVEGIAISRASSTKATS